ncbi:hypothetical protein BDQ94DRAFT_131686 [Aspergillus welwitschiae]|uniref:F-box domain-containing protein n=1 Tax=Aspergillus welwitschiae TaxID=1341132 RepID=A0A3F3PIG6_9EURO|nr:hypothetical protein BDQ94DRAFT_131686 [Aspergillus welwitschiae]RDH26657.1 hypothetical protein BDQ94DRAFT_131686 [Aspergillus welwitschiae]
MILRRVSKMELSDLPPEIILIILDYLETTAALKDICLVSKKFCAIAQPLLYHEIILGPEDVLLSILLLCRTVTTCPHIAAHVQQLDIDTDNPGFLLAEGENNSNAVNQDKLPVADIHLLEKEAQNINLSDIDASRFGTEIGDSVIFSMLIISRTQNLRSLVITLDPQGLSLLIGLAQGRMNAHTSLPCRNSLERLHLRCRKGRYNDRMNMNNIARLLSLLPLREIQISEYCSGGQASPKTDDADVTPLSSVSASSLSLCGSSIEETDIDALVGLCKNLTAFYCGQCGSHNHQLSPQRLYSLLFCRRDSLRVLQLSFGDPFANPPIFRDSQFGGSLKQFVVLEYLILDQVYLSTTPEFPSSLKHLAIRECRSPIAQLLAHIAECVLNGQLPNLQYISLHSNITHPGRMINLPQRGATDILFNKACQNLQNILDGTEITLQLEKNLLDKTVQGYRAAYEFGQPGVFWPFIFLE